MENTIATTRGIVADRNQPDKGAMSAYPLGWAALTGVLFKDLDDERDLERPPISIRMQMRLAAIALLVVGGISFGSRGAEAQYRFPLPGGYRAAPQMIMPALRGASQLGWYGGSYLAQRQYGPTANPGRWPGLAPALGFRR